MNSSAVFIIFVGSQKLLELEHLTKIAIKQTKSKIYAKITCKIFHNGPWDQTVNDDFAVDFMIA